MIKLKDVKRIETQIMRDDQAKSWWECGFYCVLVTLEMSDGSIIENREVFKVKDFINGQYLPSLSKFEALYGKMLSKRIIKSANDENDFNWARLALNQEI